MVEFLLGLGFDLEAKDNVRLHFSYIACFFLFSSSVTGLLGAITAFSLCKCMRVLSLARLV
jgi:cell division protein FtsX